MHCRCLVVITVASVLLNCAGGSDEAELPEISNSPEVMPDLVAVDVGPELMTEIKAEVVQPDPPPILDLLAYVDPMIGTKGSGNVIPGPQLPHGMVKLGPDSEVDPGSLYGYEYGNDSIAGFSHTHLEGPGGSGYGYSNVSIMPAVGELETLFAERASGFSHETEEAAPGYYAVDLTDYDVRVELTATHHAGLHRYTFPESQQALVMIDLAYTGGHCTDAHVEIIEPNIVRGWGQYDVWPIFATMGGPLWGSTGQRTVFFHAEFSKPFNASATWTGEEVDELAGSADGDDIGVALQFATIAGEQVMLKVGISFIDSDQAKKNLAAEIPEWEFEAVRLAAEQAWNQALNAVIVETDSDDLKTVFYTALYHTMIEPVDYTEGDRYWQGPGGAGLVKETDGGRFFADDWCIWDTFRTSHPLRTLVEPGMCSELVDSYLQIYEAGGWLPRCPWQATGYSRAMIGNHATAVISDLYNKGFRDYDVDLAYEAMHKSATQDSIESKDYVSMCGYINLGTTDEYIKYGYVSHECDNDQSVSMTLEYAYDDWTLGLVAADMGKESDHKNFMARAGNYAKHWNPETGFMQAKHKTGKWLEPFDPEDEVGFCEADSWKYTWFVPHDVAGLAGLMGGEEKFADKLDAFFDGDHYTADNQPDFHVPFLYNYVGQPFKTQAKVREILADAFDTTPGGLPGNDDAGGTSAWYVLAAMGLYPVAPGNGIYQISSPLFDRVAFRLDDALHPGTTFVIEANNNGAAEKYIQSATLNGKPLHRPWLKYQEIAEGGLLVLEMGDSPSQWGTDPAFRPPSLSQE